MSSRRRSSRSTARAQLAAAQDKVEALTRTADADVRQAQSDAAEARNALTAAAQERGRLLQRAEAAEAQIAVLTTATGSASAGDKPSRSRGTQTAPRGGSAT
jgi:hypothetical protein